MTIKLTIKFKTSKILNCDVKKPLLYQIDIEIFIYSD